MEGSPCARAGPPRAEAAGRCEVRRGLTVLIGGAERPRFRAGARRVRSVKLEDADGVSRGRRRGPGARA